MSIARAQVSIRHQIGLHARPAVKLTRLARNFSADVRLRGSPDGAWVNGKSIVKVMSLKLPTGTTLEIEVTGEGAESALAALTSLVARDFDEEH